MPKLYSADGVSQERTGFRDEWISRWHRGLGFDFPGTDVDFLFLEYDQRIPVALVDYKRQDNPYQPEREANVDALRWLGDAAGCSFWWVFYRPDEPAFYPQPMNLLATRLIGKLRWMPEAEYVRFLRFLRNRGNQSSKAS